LGIKGNDSPPLITTALGIALVMTAVCVLSHRWLRLLTATRHAEPDPRWTATLTTLAGLLLGVFVTLSSVGAGAIGMTALVLLYPRTPIARLVGSDIAHAVPLRRRCRPGAVSDEEVHDGDKKPAPAGSFRATRLHRTGWFDHNRGGLRRHRASHAVGQ
jgi:hypothetical protein